MSVGFVVLFTTFLVYLLNIYALGEVQPTVVSIYIYLQPLLVGGMVWLAAQVGGADYTADMGWLQVCCGVVIATGVWLVSVPRGGWQRLD
jgi:drug/metabolite transporter (DMT)-like permease